jgi:hypothetical protein
LAQSKEFAATANSGVLPKLTKGKQYEVQVRSYRTVGGVKHYGPWSASRMGGKVK